MKTYFCLRAIEFQCNFVLIKALESTKISSYEPVSSQKYENGYSTKIYNFTVLNFVLSYFWKKVRNLILYENVFLLWGHCIATSFCFEALKGTKNSSHEPVSSQKYEMGTGRKFVTLQYK